MHFGRKLTNPTSKGLSSTDTLNNMSLEHKINLPSTSRPTNQPCADLLNGSREEYINICVPLNEASIKGDWKTARVIFDERPELVRFAITDRYDTPLHVVASANVTKWTEQFLENLVDRMEKEDLELENKDGNNAFMVAIVGGSTKMVEIMLNKHEALLTISDSQKNSPVSRSAIYGNHDMTMYLYNVYEKMNNAYVREMDRGLILRHCVKSDMFDIALKVLSDYPETVNDPCNCWFILDALARRPGTLDGTGHYHTTDNNLVLDFFHQFYTKRVYIEVGLLRPSRKGQQALKLLKEVLSITVKFAQVNIDYILRGAFNDDGKCIHGSGLLFVAAELCNTKFLIEVIQVYPPALWMQNDNGYTIFHIAILHRQLDIYSLLYEIGSTKFVVASLKDKCDNTILHLVGMTSKKIQLETMSGAYSGIHQDLLWFEDVEKMLPPILREDKNKDGLTAYQLFFDSNKDLLSHSMKWMKDCMVVATLIITIAFAVAFTVPGGYNQVNGIPIFIHNRSFVVFIIADAISLFSSLTSLIVFLSMMTSSYNHRSFLRLIPLLIMLGLGTLLISLAAMMVTFAASFLVLYHNMFKHAPVIIIIFAALPVYLYINFQLPVSITMVRSLYFSRYIFNPGTTRLYRKNPGL